MIVHAQWVLVYFLCTEFSTLEAAEEPLSLLKYRNCNDNKKEEEKKNQNGLVRVEKGKQCIKIVLKLFNSASLFPAKSYSP